MTEEQPESLTDRLAAWVEGLPAWQADLALRLTEEDELPEAAVDEVLENALAECGGPETSNTMRSVSSSSFAALDVTDESPRIKALEGLRNVNVIAPGRRLDFTVDGLTVVYGQNAAGKSGYCRVFKRLCRSVDRESSILRDVFGDDSGAQEATVETVVGGGRATPRHLNLADEPPEDLAAISVFDAECADNYVTATNTIAFTPRALVLFDRMVRTQRDLHARIEEEIGALAAARPDLDEFDEDTEVGALVHSLTAESDPQRLRDGAKIGKEQRDRMSELRGLRGDPKEIERSAETAELEARSARDLAAALRKLHEVTDDAFAKRLAKLRKATADKKKAAELAREEAFSDLAVPEVGDAVWSELWEAARRFSDHSSSLGAFPSAEHGALCPLCLQEVSEEARARLSSFEEFVKSTTEAEARAAEAGVQAEIDRLDPSLVTACRPPFLDAVRSRDEELADRIQAFADVAEGRMERLRLGSGDEPLPTGEEPPAAALDLLAEALEKRAKDLRDDEARRAAAKELAELEAAEQLSKRLQALLEWHGKLKRIDLLRAAQRALNPNRVTREQNSLAEIVITAELKRSFKDELEKLDMHDAKVEVDARGELGNTVVRLQLSGASGKAPLSKVLSKGEQRAAALAFYLAEVRAGGGDGGIILDDPVSSLDDPRRRQVAERLAEEAAQRQVIVFTHDLVLFVKLLEIFQDDPPAGFGVQRIWRTRDEIGLTSPDAPWPGRNVKERIGYLRRRIQEFPNAEELGPENYRREIKGWYEELREAWERAVEEVLLGDVVQRFRQGVETSRLKHVPDFTAERRKAVKDGVGRCSSFTHDEATAGEPTQAQMDEDLQALSDFVDGIRKKKSQ